MSLQKKYARNYRARIVCLLFLAIVVVLSGCANPVGVRYLNTRETNQKLETNILSNETLSSPTEQILNRSGMAEEFSKNPVSVLQDLRTAVSTASNSDRFYALAELSFLHASNTGERSYFLAAAVYAYAFLFPSDGENLPDAFDPRLTTAVNLYNRGIALGFAVQDSEMIMLKSGIYKLPFGQLNIHLDPNTLHRGSYQMVDFVAAAKLDIRGLRNNYHWPGVGVAMVASLAPISGEKMPESSVVPPALKVSATAVLRLNNIEESLKDGGLTGEILLYTADNTTSIEINGREIPFDFWPTAAIADTLEGSTIYDLEIKGLLSGDLKLFQQTSRFKDNIFLMAPYRQGRIPVVLVHGTASSPARWAEMLNELVNDRELSQRYQFWLFTYNTGNPILYSGSLLVQGLKNIIKELDPNGQDEALRKMVVIGHSQGGLLAKLTAVDSGDRFWNGFISVPFEQLDISPEKRESLRNAFYYKPLPFVKHVVFMSTPHRGSYLTGGYINRIFKGVISLPFTLLSPLQEIFDRNPKAIRIADMKELPRSTDNMTPDNPFLNNLVSMPVSPAIKAHSIIAVNNPHAPQEKWHDGVVAYKSAHIAGVDSEFVVQSNHSSQEAPTAIEEVRRILIENLEEE